MSEKVGWDLTDPNSGSPLELWVLGKRRVEARPGSAGHMEVGHLSSMFSTSMFSTPHICRHTPVARKDPNERSSQMTSQTRGSNGLESFVRWGLPEGKASR